MGKNIIYKASLRSK